MRAPHFCSGCPHNSSTQADDDQLVGAGIGCHTMVMLGGAKAGDVRGLTQMGGEGVQWIGAAPFLEPRHFVQNLGDGTLHHSGSLAIRAAVAADLHVTYKVLYNQTVAMTGGQDVPGGMSVAAARALARGRGRQARDRHRPTTRRATRARRTRCARARRCGARRRSWRRSRA